jgi:hypothetical protein
MHDRCSAAGSSIMHDQGDLWAYHRRGSRVFHVSARRDDLFRLNNPASSGFTFAVAVFFASLIGTFPHRNGHGVSA